MRCQRPGRCRDDDTSVRACLGGDRSAGIRRRLAALIARHVARESGREGPVQVEARRDRAERLGPIDAVDVPVELQPGVGEVPRHVFECVRDHIRLTSVHVRVGARDDRERSVDILRLALARHTVLVGDRLQPRVERLVIVRVGDEAADAAVLVALGEDGDDRLDDLEPTRAVIGAGEGVVGVERVECEVVDVTGDGREGAIRGCRERRHRRDQSGHERNDQRRREPRGELRERRREGAGRGRSQAGSGHAPNPRTPCRRRALQWTP